jgi:hypothetical protein
VGRRSDPRYELPVVDLDVDLGFWGYIKKAIMGLWKLGWGMMQGSQGHLTPTELGEHPF